MTERIQDFLRRRREAGQDDGPCLIVDLDVVRDNYQTFAKALPDSRVFYAVKANPAPELLSLLASLGSCFDTASVAEIEMVLAAGATADRISYGNTIKKERDVARAFALGVRMFAVDCKAEVEKVARAAPGSRVFCRILSDCVGAEWPLSRKFGCEPAMAVEVIEHAFKLAVYSYTPVWLAGIFLILPGLRFLALTGFYGAYVLSAGVARLMKSPAQRTQIYVVVIVLCACALAFGAAAAIGGLGGLAQIGNNSSILDPSTQIRNGISAQSSQEAEQILNHFLNRLPVITLKEGSRARVYIGRDILIPSYAEHRVNPTL